VTMLPSTSPRSPEDRQAVCDLLNPLVASGIDLYAACKKAHWNVRGSSFSLLHELFGKTADEVTDRVDILAERVAQLGGMALGTAQEVAEETGLEPYPRDVRDGLEHCRLLFDRIGALVYLVTDAAVKVADLGDTTTVQQLEDAALALDKAGWMIGSHAMPSTMTEAE